MASRRSFALALALVALATTAISCGGAKRPADMPQLYPVSVKIIQDGQPLEGAQVALFASDQELMRWPCGGTTGPDGVVALSTYNFPGAPAGKFAVCVSKIEYVNHATSYEEAQKMQEEGLKEEQYNLIDPKFDSGALSPLSIEIQASKDNPVAEFDVGEAVHIERGMIGQ